MNLQDVNGANGIGQPGVQGNDIGGGTSADDKLGQGNGLHDAFANSVSDVAHTVYMPNAPTHMRHGGPLVSEPTSTFPYDPAAAPGVSASSEVSPSVVVITGTVSPAQNTTSPSTASQPGSSQQSGLSTGQLFAAIFFPIAIVLATVILFLLYLRLRRKRRASEARELKVFPPTYGGPATVDDQNVYTTPASLPQGTQAIRSSYYAPPPQPANGMNYQEEPPPPYQPSTSAVSTETPPQGLLHPQPRRLTESNLFTHSQASTTVSPFADPADEDAVSEISEPVSMDRRRNSDEHSIVSEISQENGHEPATHHGV